MEILLVAIGFLGILAWGDWLFVRLAPRLCDHPFERALAGFGLLFGIGSYLLHALGFLGLLYKPLAVGFLIFCVAGIVIRVIDRERPVWKRPTDWTGWDRFFFAAICLVAVIDLIGCLTPEIRDDCLINHQSIPAGYANAHRIDMHPYNANMGRPQLLQTWYILPLLYQNVFGPKLIHSFLGLFGLAAMAWLALRTADRKACLPAVFLFGTLPVFVMYTNCAYVDLGRIYYELLPLCLILRFQQDRRWSTLILAAVIFGFGMGVHWLSSFFGWPVLTATTFFAVGLGGGERSWRRAFGAAALFGGIAFLVFSPWIIRNWIVLGNPAQPLFRVPAGADEAQRFSPEVLSYFGALKELPQRIFRSVQVISKSGNCPPILLIGAIILKFILRDRDPRRAAMLLFAVFHLMIFAITLPIQDGRYILPGMAVSVVVFFHYAETLLANYRQYRPYLLVGITLLGLLNFAMAKQRLYYDYSEPPWPVYTREAVERFLTNRFGDRSMIHYINDELPEDSKVLLDDAVGALYIWRPFMARNYHDTRITDAFVRKTRDNVELLEWFRKYGVTHILVKTGMRLQKVGFTEALLQEPDFPTDDLNEEQKERLDQFVREHLLPIHTVGDETLFKVVDDTHWVERLLDGLPAPSSEDANK